MNGESCESAEKDEVTILTGGEKGQSEIQRLTGTRLRKRNLELIPETRSISVSPKPSCYLG